MQHNILYILLTKIGDMIGLKKKIHLTIICYLVLSFLPHKNFSQERKISEDELIEDKISGFWIGQLTGNYTRTSF